ncbi:MAG TPA: carboxypeptidase-like regulatory domain-containing protein [Candidatus Acidoferrales bacterium]|nr:carboxypeptidase-like regulatory domain-containing protein [Candidatus Acidoferrales bacterium]
MLSFEERELARRFHELGAQIVVPEATTRRTRVGIPLLVLLVTLTAIAVVLLLIVRGDDTSNTANPPSPSATRSSRPSAAAGVIASPTPSHRATPYGALPSQILPTPGTTYTVTGTITELEADGNQHPVNGARIDVFVRGERGGYHWMSDVTDATGRYELWGIPAGATATLYAAADDGAGHASSVQPCAHQLVMLADESVDIEIVPMAAGGDAASAAVKRQRSPSLRLGGEPLIDGQVFERAADGSRIAVPNAMVWIGGDTEPLIAVTLTDARGNYVMCAPPKPLEHDLEATAPGYRSSKAMPHENSNGLTVDFEMSR